ncbi:phosphatase PAP2 family protein [Sphingobacterium paucimobilis]|uniref:Phosphatidic acid phosphatase type 2/haloperoxidase domain-containing protein n=1 Tax=Sphingobacterium paucimobilis HER1398 TaxID=1346330 RepID=U2JE25_9SPHI|nr:phosphatase PAP2 family protein [Sphingobacterium paucimobilis]ERJ60933.1 hypothetical protein M472_19440 [Sphingobacterium paucimobilis HER1398]
MKSTVNKNILKIRLSYFFLPVLLLMAVFGFLFYSRALLHSEYIELQKELFLYGNAELSVYPVLMDNLTQLGDALILLSFLTILFVIAPKCWECFINALLISALFTAILKPLFAIPRPAAFLQEKFTIIGPKLVGSNSFPSGHSITVFTILGVILFAFMPQRIILKILWCLFICVLGAILISTRIGVGAHYPLDVLVGSIFGYLSALIGIVVTQKFNLWTWIDKVKLYPIFMLLFTVSTVIIIFKILDTNLFIFYLALFSLLISLFVITRIYVQKKY